MGKPNLLRFIFRRVGLRWALWVCTRMRQLSVSSIQRTKASFFLRSLDVRSKARRRKAASNLVESHQAFPPARNYLAIAGWVAGVAFADDTEAEDANDAGLSYSPATSARWRTKARTVLIVGVATPTSSPSS